MIATLSALLLAATAPAPDGVLMGCVFKPETGPFTGFAIFLPADQADGALNPNQVDDPGKMLAPGGFAGIHGLKFTGPNRLSLRFTGGEMYEATLDSDGRALRKGVCQAGPAQDRESAFTFFGSVLKGLNQDSGK